MVPKLTSHTERKREGGDGIKRLFSSLFKKALKNKDSKRLQNEAVIFYKQIGLNESNFFSVRD